MPFVFDACALIAFLRDEAGADQVERLLADEHAECLAHAVNLCEVYYDFLRASNEEAVARGAIEDLTALGLVAREDLDPLFWQDAGRYKAKGRISLADCFAIALSQRVGGTVVTTDHAEFDPIAARNQCRVRFIR